MMDVASLRMLSRRYAAERAEPNGSHAREEGSAAPKAVAMLVGFRPRLHEVAGSRGGRRIPERMTAHTRIRAKATNTTGPEDTRLTRCRVCLRHPLAAPR